MPSLTGRRIALTRARIGDDALATRLRALGAELLETPAISVGPPSSWHELDRALLDLDRFDWVAFASANGVESTVARAGALGIAPAALGRARLAAVGAATGRRLAQLVRAPEVVPHGASGAALAEALAGQVRGKRVLVPRAEDGRPELAQGLAEAGAQVESPAAYRTALAPAASLSALRQAVVSGALDAVVFASPSAVRGVLAALEEDRVALGEVVIAAIGLTTAAELRAHGLEADVLPARAGATELADALAAHFVARG